MPRKAKKPAPKPQARKGRPPKADPVSKANTQSKALFLDHHLPEIAKLKERARTAQAHLRNGYKAAKSDGFLKIDFDVAFLLQTQMGERQMRTEIARKAQVAKWLKYKIGDQLDLFLQEDTRDIEAEAYAAGEEASKSNKPAEPPLPAGEPPFDAYMRGFHEHQESILTGMKKADYTPSSGVPMTRSQFRAQQAAAKTAQKYVDEQATKLFTKKSPDEAAE